MIYTATAAIFIEQNLHDSCDIFVLCLHILACFLYAKEVIKLTKIDKYFKEKNKKLISRINIDLNEKESINTIISNDLTLTKLFKK